MSKLQPALSGSSYPDVPFVDGAGKPVRFSDFKGRVVVLNLWATWCAPCVKEMPTLAALQQSFKDRPVTVVALSTDSNGQVDKAKAFIAAHPPLGFYHDANLAVTSAIQPRVQGFPTTLVYDEEGRLRGSVQGDADWSSPEAKAVISALLP
jgi:thiol-disulfide isomerase/thioredoxin